MQDKRILTVTAAAANYDLCTLDQAKAELDIAGTDTSWDAWLDGTTGQPGAIAQVSKAIARYCGSRVFHVEALSEVVYLDQFWRSHHNSRTEALQLSRWPLVKVTSVTIDAGLSGEAVLTENTDFAVKADTGELLRLDSSSGLLTRWLASTVTVAYAAGMGALATETYAVTGATPGYTVTNGANFSIDQGVTYASGTALAAVTGTPGAGQYSLDTATGKYTFAAADDGQMLSIVYGYNQIEDDLTYAALRYITGRAKEEGRDPALMEEENPQLGRKRYWVPGTAQGASLPPEIRDLVSQYRPPVLA